MISIKHLSKKTKRISALALSAALLLTGAVAFFTTKDTKVNVFEVGRVDIELWENFDLSQNSALEVDETFGPEDTETPQLMNLIPNKQIIKAPWIENTGTTGAYVYMSVSIPVDTAVVIGSDGNKLNAGEPISTEMFSLINENGLPGVNDGWEQIYVQYNVEKDGTIYNVYYYGYQNVIVRDGTSPKLFEKVKCVNTDSPYKTDSTDIRTYNLPINAYAIQDRNMSDDIRKNFKVAFGIGPEIEEDPDNPDTPDEPEEKVDEPFEFTPSGNEKIYSIPTYNWTSPYKYIKVSDQVLNNESVMNIELSKNNFNEYNGGTVPDFENKKLSELIAETYDSPSDAICTSGYYTNTKAYQININYNDVPILMVVSKPFSAKDGSIVDKGLYMLCYEQDNIIHCPTCKLTDIPNETFKTLFDKNDYCDVRVEGNEDKVDVISDDMAYKKINTNESLTNLYVGDGHYFLKTKISDLINAGPTRDFYRESDYLRYTNNELSEEFEIDWATSIVNFKDDVEKVYCGLWDVEMMKYTKPDGTVYYEYVDSEMETIEEVGLEIGYEEILRLTEIKTGEDVTGYKIELTTNMKEAFPVEDVSVIIDEDSHTATLCLFPDEENEPYEMTYTENEGVKTFAGLIEGYNGTFTEIYMEDALIGYYAVADSSTSGVVDTNTHMVYDEYMNSYNNTIYIPESISYTPITVEEAFASEPEQLYFKVGDEYIYSDDIYYQRGYVDGLPENWRSLQWFEDSDCNVEFDLVDFIDNYDIQENGEWFGESFYYKDGDNYQYQWIYGYPVSYISGRTNDNHYYSYSSELYTASLNNPIEYDLTEVDCNASPVKEAVENNNIYIISEGQYKKVDASEVITFDSVCDSLVITEIPKGIYIVFDADGYYRPRVSFYEKGDK